MNIEKIETKLQTILEDDDLEITEENVGDKIKGILEYAIMKFARLNEAMIDIEDFREEYDEDILDEENKEIFEFATRTIICAIEKEYYFDKNKIIEIMTELFVNQDFYDLMKNNFPSIIKLVDKLNSVDCIFGIKDIMDWLNDGFEEIDTEYIEDISVYEYFDNEFEDFNNLFVSDKEQKIVSNKK